MKTTRMTILLAAFFVSSASNAALTGNHIEATAFFPSLTTPDFTAGPLSAVVGVGTEFANGDFAPFAGPSFDFDDWSLTINQDQVGNAPGEFNGYQFYDVLSEIGAFTGFFVVSDSTGFFSGDPSRIFFDANNLYVNFQGLDFRGQIDATIVLGIEVQEVPLAPAAWLFGSALVGLGVLKRKKLA